MMQIGCLAVRVAAGGTSDLDELLDLRMADRQVNGSAATAQASLADRQGQGVHDANKGDDSGRLSVLADLLADGTQVPPIAADSAAARGEPDVFVPEINDSFEAVARLIQETGNRKSARRASVGQHRRRRHEPEIGNVVVQALRVPIVIREGAGDAGEHGLDRFVG